MNMHDVEQSVVLVVDDEELNVDLLLRMLRRAEFKRAHGTTDPLGIPALMRELSPDIVLLDLHMPAVDGLQALEQIRDIAGRDTYLPVVVLTADVTSEAKQRALQAGADDFLTKPFDRSEVMLRIRNLLKTRQLYMQLQQQNDTLEQKVLERTDELEQAKHEILQLLGRASEYRDDLTGKHTMRVGWLSGLIAERLGLDEDSVRMIRMAAPLHDIGKIGIPDQLLMKPGRFDPEEFERMKAHTTIGASILEGTIFPVLKLAGTIALAHHEKWDGSGYPLGLKGEDIPIAARIVAIADFYDALTHERPYKQAWTPEATIEEMVRQRGAHFDPDVVDAFVRLYESRALDEMLAV